MKAFALVPRGGSIVAQARALLAKAVTPEQAKQLRDQAATIAFFAKERGESEELQREAIEARLWFERRIGELTAEIPKATKADAGMVGGKASNVVLPASKASALAQAGISKMQASRWERLARIPDGEFEQLAKQRAAGGKPSKQDRRTPRWFFDALNENFGPFRLDAFASADNALLPRFYTKETNGLEQPWEDVTFVNPEFKTMMEKTVNKALLEANLSRRSVVLGPAVGSQKWLHGLAIYGTIWMPDCRINYDDPDGKPTGGRHHESGADRDTVVMTFGGEHRNSDADRKAGVFRVMRLAVAHLRPEGQT